ncbi:MAG: hypothetical protein JWQ43_2703 [Glaciihabitans sp.]|nr:hypothetical protein [Glaciihabitans sp.]
MANILRFFRRSAAPTTVEPTRVEPTPVESARVKSAPVESASVDATPADLTPAEPTSAESGTGETSAIEPSAIEPSAIEPSAIEQSAVEPSAASTGEVARLAPVQIGRVILDPVQEAALSITPGAITSLVDRLVHERILHALGPNGSFALTIRLGDDTSMFDETFADTMAADISATISNAFGEQLGLASARHESTPALGAAAPIGVPAGRRRADAQGHERLSA